MIKTFIKNIFFTVFAHFIVRSGDKRYIYLTFDDGPHPVITQKVIDMLGLHAVHATFFMTGTEMQKYPAIVSAVAAAGHRIAYHGYSHTSMKKQSLRDFITDIRKARAISNSCGVKLDLYRPPYGDLSLGGFIYLILSGWKTIMWSLDSRDSFDSEQQVVYNITADRIKPGEIILFHDDYEKTVNVLRRILPSYKQKQLFISTEF